MNNKDRIESLIEQTLEKCLSWVETDSNGNTYFVDPIDGEEISAHYGATHAAAALIIRGSIIADSEMYSKGIGLMVSILNRWEKSKVLPGFHNDFNNFALCVSHKYIKDYLIAERVKRTVLNTADSNNPTTNWLPMRWYVNRCREDWTNDLRYHKIINRCKKDILSATNSDGGVEDRLPKGVSFNLQYDIATVSVLQFLRDAEDLNLSKELGFLLNAVAPDGDINYQGRGTNQIFAWGLWVYLLASSKNENELSLALDFLSPKLKKMLNNHSMMLNDWDGKEKFHWWDYHYTSVYTAHFLFWIVLAMRDYGRYPIADTIVDDCSTGLRIYKNSCSFVSVFEGRKEYLAEFGPVITAFWTKKRGMICKGTFAPWKGYFGNKYVYTDLVLRNFFGILRVQSNRRWLDNRYVHKIIPSLRTTASHCIKPVFCRVMVGNSNGEVEITWSNNSSGIFILNIPSFSKDIGLEASVDAVPISMICVGTIRNQYSWMYLYQSKPISNFKSIKLIVK